MGRSAAEVSIPLRSVHSQKVILTIRGPSPMFPLTSGHTRNQNNAQNSLVHPKPSNLRSRLFAYLTAESLKAGNNSTVILAGPGSFLAQKSQKKRRNCGNQQVSLRSSCWNRI